MFDSVFELNPFLVAYGKHVGFIQKSKNSLK